MRKQKWLVLAGAKTTHVGLSDWYLELPFLFELSAQLRLVLNSFLIFPSAHSEY